MISFNTFVQRLRENTSASSHDMGQSLVDHLNTITDDLQNWNRENNKRIRDTIEKNPRLRNKLVVPLEDINPAFERRRPNVLINGNEFAFEIKIMYDGSHNIPLYFKYNADKEYIDQSDYETELDEPVLRSDINYLNEMIRFVKKTYKVTRTNLNSFSTNDTLSDSFLTIFDSDKPTVVYANGNNKHSNCMLLKYVQNESVNRSFPQDSIFVGFAKLSTIDK